jgi:hypothetical protein
MPGQVAQVTFSVDGLPQETRINPPYTFDWDSSTVEVGNHTIGLIVRDHVGNQAETSTTVAVVPLLLATLISPVNDQEIGQTIPLEVVVDGSFNNVERVEFSVNGTIVDRLRTPPYETVLDTADFEPGTYVILVTVYDAQGNQQEISSEITLNEPPPPSPQPTATVSATRPASQPQPELEEDDSGSGSLTNIFKSPILYIVLGIILLGLFGAFIAFFLWHRVRSANQRTEKSYHDEIGDFERRVIEEAKAHGKVTPESPITAEKTGMAATAENSRIIPPPLPKRKSIPDEANVTQMLPRSPIVDSAAAAKLQKQAYFLVTHAGMNKAHWYSLKEDEIIIGRAKDADIILIDMAVSRHHAVVRFENGQFTYLDLEPTNPSFINGKAYNEPVQVKEGDEIVVGETRLVFKNSI